MASVLILLDGWLETKPPLFVLGEQCWILRMDEWPSQVRINTKAGQFGRKKRTEDVPAVRETGSGPHKWYQSDYGSRTKMEGLFKICLDRTDVENAKHEHWRTDERLDLGSDQVGLTLGMGKFKIIWRMIGLLKVLWITRESYPRNYSKCWKQHRGLLKSMDPDSEVKKREGLTKRFLKLKEGKSGYRNWTKKLSRLTKLERLGRNRVGLLRHNCSDTVCPGVYGNREFPRRDCPSSRVLSWRLWKPESCQDVTVVASVGTRLVRHRVSVLLIVCGNPI
ncbi:hypothetical protein F2Q70_00025151 [Brassica cretica]|uniref:Uncharacterized protein n=1 Tax=Brassica cretica TaxID=69181 RepID=A0A8S9L8L7_BRACR|nr:hypothetical protein F2Q70_00025151 [Brassica cretica]